MIFSEYFDSWSKEYYAKGVSVGKNGDFYTAVSVGEIFGFLCAKRFVNLINSNIIKLPIDVVEIGANEGYFINDFANYLMQNHQNIYEKINFCIIEPHEKLRQIQTKNTRNKFLHFYLQDFKSKNAFFISNELLDAFACELYDNGKIAFVNNHKIIFKENTKDFLYLKNPEFKKGEFCPYLYDFFNLLKNNCEEFYFLTFDYFNEFLKDDFSLKIFKNHNIIDPFLADLSTLYANSDITYNVNYDEVKFYLSSLNLNHTLKKQSVALCDFGIETFTEPKYINQIKNLLFGFSDNFKCLEIFKK